MKISLDWLSDFVEFPEKDPRRIAEHLTLATAEVEEVEVQGELLGRCVVGKVLKLRRHPNADKLSLCAVETDQGSKSVVCGGTNLREGMLVAFAHVGAKVRWHGGSLQELAQTRIRGEESEGMICAAEELDIAHRFPPKPEDGDRPVVDLGEGLAAGVPLRAALQLTDTVFHIDNHAITHRADLFSHIGIARECVALGLGRRKKKKASESPRFTGDPVPFKFVVAGKKLMPRYCACTIAIDALGETPEWMKRRLLAVGWRSLNLPIDITNYVASEVGVPLHSFDVADIRGTVRMRRAKEGERIVTLDRRECSLPGGALVLSDDEGIFDLLGIMGGLRSSTKENTRQIYLHSASLDPVSIRRTIIATGHRTDAATMYEKGVPAVTTERGFFRALELFLAHVPGARITSKLASHGENGKAKPLALSIPRAVSVLGSPVASGEMERSLSRLEFGVRKKGKDALLVTPPLHRLGDIRIPADLIEEIARVRRFHVGSPVAPLGSVKPPPMNEHLARMRSALKEEGFREAVTLSLVGEALLRRSGFDAAGLSELENPLGEDLKYLRPSLLPRLLEAALGNLERAEGDVLHFEAGRVFLRDGEHVSLAFLIAEKHAGALLHEPFLRAKQAVGSLLRSAGHTPEFIGAKAPSACRHPARALSVRACGKHLGEVFEVHPGVLRAWGFPQRVAAAELSLTEIRALPGAEAIFQPLPQFPAITYDTTVAVPAHVAASSLLSKARGISPLLREVRVNDLYQRAAREPRNITFRCVYGAPDRTLTEEEIRPVHAKIEKELQSF